ncbi:MAG TPA: hypothetical protein VD999_06000 [Vitreimonas sp.]|nr:hypothetical protein [Vitreimonas sp.]
MQLTLHKHMTNQEIADLFNFIAGVLALKDSNVFRSRAYQNAATVIEQYPQPLHEMFLNNPDFDKLPGIGDTLSEKLGELFTTGSIKAFEKYVADLPAGMWPLFKLPGIGVKKAFVLAVHFKLDDEATALSKILEHAQQGEIRQLEKFGEKSEKDLISIIESYKPKNRLPYMEAKQVADELKAELEKCEAISRVDVLGSLRRQSPTVGDIDLGIATDNMDLVKSFVKNMKIVKRVAAAGEQLIRIVMTNDYQADIKVSTPDEWGAFLQHFTGSKEHNIKLRELALKQGKSLSEHGIKEEHNGQQILKKFADEEAFYKYLGLRWIEPSKRAGGEEIDQAKL